MEFDKSRVYTALNADELHVGDIIIGDDCIGGLRTKVEFDKVAPFTSVITNIREESNSCRFETAYVQSWHLAYLVKRKPESKYVPWTKENCPLKCGDVVRYKNSVDKRTTIIDAIDLSDENDNVIHFAFDYTDCEYGINNWASLDYLFNCYVMADGTPCGMKVEA